MPLETGLQTLVLAVDPSGPMAVPAVLNCGLRLVLLPTGTCPVAWQVPYLFENLVIDLLSVDQLWTLMQTLVLASD